MESTAAKIAKFLVYLVAFSIFVFANPYMSYGKSIQDIDEFQAIYEFYDKYLQGPLFNYFIQFSIVFWITNEVFGSLILVTMVDFIHLLMSKKEKLIPYKEYKKIMQDQLKTYTGNHIDHIAK